MHTGLVVQACNPSSQVQVRGRGGGAVRGGAEVQGHPRLPVKFEVNLGNETLFRKENSIKKKKRVG